MLPRRPSPRRAVPRRRRSLAAFPECLEARIVLSTFDVSSEAGLRSAIATADSNGDASNVIAITGSIALSDTTAGQLVIENATNTPKSLRIVGQGVSPSGTILSGSSTWNTRAGTGSGAERRIGS
jgi:hypothetical protein